MNYIMGSLRLKQFSIRFLLFFSFFLFVFHTNAQQISQEESEAFKAQLLEAKDVSGRLAEKEQCYINEDKNLQKRSESLQANVGDLHRQEKEQSADLKRYTLEASEFQRDFERNKQEVSNINAHIRSIERQIRSKQGALDKCKDDAWIFGFVCDVAAEISGLNKDLSRSRAQRQSMEINRNGLAKQLDAASKRKTESTEKLRKTQSSLTKTTESIKSTESNIKKIKVSLENIRNSKQSYAVVNEDFKSVFTEFNSLDPQSDRRSIIRRLRNSSDALKTQISTINILLKENNVKLPDGRLACTQ